MTCDKRLDRIEKELTDYIYQKQVCKLCGQAPEFKFEDNGIAEAPKVEVSQIYCANCDYIL